MAFTLGIDYGTNSVRALLVDVSNGRELASCVVDYPSGKQGTAKRSVSPLFGLKSQTEGAFCVGGFQIEIIFHGTLMGYFPPRDFSRAQSVFTSRTVLARIPAISFSGSEILT
jgi:hypothetical protein